MQNHRHRRRAATSGAVLLAALLAVAGCGTDSPDQGGAAVVLEPAAPAQTLRGVCPDTVTIQLQWQPQSDQGGLFQLLGPGYRVDEETKSVEGPLVAGGKDTGVRLQLRAGGPAIGFQSVPSRMYVDDTVTLGVVHGEQVIAASAAKSVVAVTPLLKYSPSILMWDPASHPDWRSIADIGRSNAPVVVSKEQIFPQWLVAKGLLKQSQIDTGYDGAPARFVADPTIAQQGFASAEPYVYEREARAWNKPVAYDLIKNSGFDTYASNLTVRADTVDGLAPCLAKLVPIVQQAGADFGSAPADANAKVVDIVSRTPAFTPYPAGEAEFAAKQLVELGLLANEADGSFGTYEQARTQRNLEDLRPILVAGGAAIPPALTAGEIFTNRFTDPKIGIR
ncbi:nitrate ABC transporter substrate-binding protein [Nocardia sp. NPDC055049]